ncbi:PTS sugar transporter subunit IIA [bacterium]|nr:PTS sugar transporter subunit IIA [bacterium]MBU1613899.1 PTS sugar transporter subunit IIA [bacterium]
MIGIVIATHGDLGSGVLKTAEAACGPQPDIEVVRFSASKSPDDLEKELREVIKRKNEGDGVLILTDTFGSSCSNIAKSCLKDNQIEIVTGVNLPMLFDCIMYRPMLSLKEAAKKAKQGGHKAIINVREALKNEESCPHPE